MSLQETDRAAAAVAKASRVKLSDIEAAMGGVYYTSGSHAVGADISSEHDTSLALLTVCFVVMRNGFTVIGKSAPASPANFNADLGRKLAYEDAVRQLWPLMGFALCSKLYDGDHDAD